MTINQTCARCYQFVGQCVCAAGLSDMAGINAWRAQSQQGVFGTNRDVEPVRFSQTRPAPPWWRRVVRRLGERLVAWGEA